MQYQGHQQRNNFTHIPKHGTGGARPGGGLIPFTELRKVLEKNKYQNEILVKQAATAPEIIEEIKAVPLADYYHFYDINMKVTNEDLFEAKTLVEVILMLRHPEYALMQVSQKDQVFQKKCLEFQQKISSGELKGTSYSRQRKRLADAFGEDGGGAPVSMIKKDSLLIDVLCYLENIQLLVFTHEDTLTNVSFTPSDARTWSHDKDTYILDCTAMGYTSLYTSIESSIMATYMDRLEYSDPVCIINWPIATGTKDELLEMLSATDADESLVKKEKKDVLAKRVGRTQTLAHFGKWVMQVDK
jgi:hypothetical protein